MALGLYRVVTRDLTINGKTKTAIMQVDQVPNSGTVHTVRLVQQVISIEIYRDSVVVTLDDQSTTQNPESEILLNIASDPIGISQLRNRHVEKIILNAADGQEVLWEHDCAEDSHQTVALIWYSEPHQITSVHDLLNS